jgi:hypothetical protein
MNSLLLIAFAILAVTLIDTVGAFASRRLQFNYTYLSVLTLTVYWMIGYYGAGIASNKMVLLASVVVGAYDATVGFKLSKICKANFGIFEKETEKVTYGYVLVAMIIIAPLFSGIGYAIKTNL